MTGSLHVSVMLGVGGRPCCVANRWNELGVDHETLPWLGSRGSITPEGTLGTVL